MNVLFSLLPIRYLVSVFSNTYCIMGIIDSVMWFLQLDTFGFVLRKYYGYFNALVPYQRPGNRYNHHEL